MLTSEDLHETYRNVHPEDAEDGRTSRFSEDLKMSSQEKCPRNFGPGHENVPPKWGLTNTHMFAITSSLSAWYLILI